MKLLADLHVHSRASLDGRSSVEALIETARTRGLSAITVSDHDLCTPLPDCKDLFLIPGVEITSANGHILGLFLDAPIDFAALGKFPPPAQAIAAIHASGGLAVLAHPFAPQKLAPEEIARLGFDAIETANARAMLKPGANEKARQLSQKLSLPGTGGSDAHCAKELGGCVTEFSCRAERSIESRKLPRRRGPRLQMGLEGTVQNPPRAKLRHGSVALQGALLFCRVHRARCVSRIKENCHVRCDESHRSCQKA